MWYGQMSLYLARAQRVVIGADLTRASLELGAAAAHRFNLDQVRFVETDLQHPGLRSGSFDVVYSSGVLHHTPDPRAAFVRIAHLARPGGSSSSGYTTHSRASRFGCAASSHNCRDIDSSRMIQYCAIGRMSQHGARPGYETNTSTPRSIVTHWLRCKVGLPRTVSNTCGHIQARWSARNQRSYSRDLRITGVLKDG